MYISSRPSLLLQCRCLPDTCVIKVQPGVLKYTALWASQRYGTSSSQIRLTGQSRVINAQWLLAEYETTFIVPTAYGHVRHQFKYDFLFSFSNSTPLQATLGPHAGLSTILLGIHRGPTSVESKSIHPRWRLVNIKVLCV